MIQRLILWFASLALLLPGSAGARMNVVATLPDFASIAREIGGKQVQVTSLAKGTEDAHFVDARPTFVVTLNKADMLLAGGADLEIGWLPPLVNNARNRNILPGGPGHIVLSRNVEMLEMPGAPVDRSAGDVHASGNPHYWLDPLNGKIIAAHIAEVFSSRDTANARLYQANLEKFNKRVDQKLSEWTRLMEPHRGTKVITYHKSYEYLAARFGLEIVDQLEPKPGIEPSPAHIKSLIPRAKAEGVKLVMIEPFRPRRTPAYVAETIGARLVSVPVSVEGHPKAKDYFSLFDYALGQIADALKTPAR